MSQRQPWSDERAEQLIGNLLRAGVLLAAATMLLTGVVYLARFGSQTADFKAFRGEPEELRSVSSVVRGVVQLHLPALMQLGVLLLIGTPIARVVLAIYAFAREKDRLYVAISFIVLLVLCYSLLGHGI